MLTILHRIEQVVVWIGLIAGWTLLLPMIVSRFYDIIARQYTDAQSTVVQFIEWDAFFLLVCLIFGFGYFRDAHARIDILRERFSTRAIAWIEVLGIVFLLVPFCIVCIVYGVEHATIAYRFNETWWVPYADGWMRKSIIPIGFSLLLVSAMVIMLRNLAFLITGDGQPEPRPPEEDRSGEVLNTP